MPTRPFRELLEKLPAHRRRNAGRRMTQARLAETLGVKQGEVSNIEHRTDVYLSTLAGYIEALGGKLGIRAVFPDREMRITQFEQFPN